MKILRFLIPVLFLFIGVVPARAADCWLSPRGAGAHNGKSASDAYPADKAQKCWEQTDAAGTLHVLEGNYSADNGTFWHLSINERNGGSKKASVFKTLKGEGKAVLQGSRPVPYSPQTKERGEKWIVFGRGAALVRIENFTVTRVASGITAAAGGNNQLEFLNLHFEDTRQNIEVLGHPQCQSKNACKKIPEEKITKNILIKNTSGLRYSKRHVRLGNGVSQVRVEDSEADSGFLDGDFAVGFDAENPSHDIVFSHCKSSRNLYSLSEYWNGDGFKSEKETYNIRWEHCSAFDNADGGFDLKTDGAVLDDVTALRNSRNIRLWSPQKSVVTHAVASDSKHYGGSGTEAGLWVQGEAECRYCTIQNNQIQVHTENNGYPARVTLEDSLVSMDAAPGRELIRQEDGTHVDLVRTSLQKKGAL